jgi:hypothetical protein
MYWNFSFICVGVCVCVGGGGKDLASNKILKLDLFYFHELMQVCMIFNNLH